MLTLSDASKNKIGVFKVDCPVSTETIRAKDVTANGEGEQQ